MNLRIVAVVAAATALVGLCGRAQASTASAFELDLFKTSASTNDYKFDSGAGTLKSNWIAVSLKDLSPVDPSGDVSSLTQPTKVQFDLKDYSASTGTFNSGTVSFSDGTNTLFTISGEAKWNPTDGNLSTLNSHAVSFFGNGEYAAYNVGYGASYAFNLDAPVDANGKVKMGIVKVAPSAPVPEFGTLFSMGGMLLGGTGFAFLRRRVA